jgi:hypothetical protein
MATFSSRHGFEPQDAEITVRNDAPYNLRGVVVDIAYEAGLDPHSMRSIVCSTLREREDTSNWSAFPNVDNEVRGHLDSCPWYAVYDIIEATYEVLARSVREGRRYDRPLQPDLFADEINKVFRKDGIGWQLGDGQVQMRGPEAFEQTVRTANAALAQTGRETAAREIHEALHDLSRRPEPDLTGALQHGLAALECVMRDVCGDPRATLGALLAKHKGLIPAPLDQGIEKIWGFASEQGRHVREGRDTDAEEVELAVQVAAATAAYLTKKHSR